MSKTVSVEEIREIVLAKSNLSGKKKIEPDMNLFDSGYLDSFSVMQVVQDLEDKLEIIFDYNDLRRDYFKSAETLHALLQKKYLAKK